MSEPSASASAPIALIAGNGRLPVQVAGALSAAGHPPVIIAIKGEADLQVRKMAAVELGWGQIGKLYSEMKKGGCRDVVLIGGVSRRPDFSSILGDLGTLRRLPAIIKALAGGDDSLLTKVIGLIEKEGFKVVGIKDVAPGLLAGHGVLGAVKPAQDDLRDMDLALKAVRKLGELDIGQAAVAVAGRVVALEGAEGTDAMLERCASLRQSGRIRAKAKCGVLVKAAKPGQDSRVDLPTVGPRTVELAKAAGLAGIAIEAGAALIADRDDTLQQADAAGLFILGIGAGNSADGAAP